MPRSVVRGERFRELTGTPTGASRKQHKISQTTKGNDCYPGFRVLSKASESSPEITPAASLNALSSEAASSTGHAPDTSNVTRDCQNVGVVRRACVYVRDGFKEPLH